MSPSPRKDPLLAASRNASTANTNNGASTAPLRISFAKIKEPLEVPNLLALQTESFDWLVGNDVWKERGAEENVQCAASEAVAEPETNPLKS